MNGCFKKIDDCIKAHIEATIAREKSQNIEDSIFFSSYTVGIKVFKDATKKLKKMLRQGNLETIGFLKDDAIMVLNRILIRLQDGLDLLVEKSC